MANRIETSLLVKGLTADTYTLDVRGKTFVDGDIEINGNVNIVGTATTINTQTVQARDNKIELNYSGSTSSAIGGGIEILSGRTDGSGVSLTIDTDRDWNSNTGFNITGRTDDSTTNGLKVVNLTGGTTLVVRNDGNVGIGTSSPTEKLHILGNTKITGNLNLGTVSSLTPLINLGIDSLGNIATGSTAFQSGLTANTISATSLNVDYIDFNTTVTGITTQFGRVNWDSGTGTLNIGIGDSTTGLVDFQVGQEEVVRVYNAETTTLQKGEIVYVSGSQGNRPAVKRASATSDGYSVTTLGVVDLAIPSGSQGYVTTFGIISNLNTSGLTGGTPIWLSPTTPGAYTATKPQAPDHTVLLGYVVRVSSTVGSIFVNISNGWELDELHDVRISAATEGDLLIRGSYSGSPVWVNSKTLNGSYTITGSTSINNGLYVTGNTTLQSFTAETGTINGNLNVTGTTNITGQTSVGSTFYSNQRVFQVSQDAAFMSFGSLVGSSGTTAIYFNQTTPTSLNYTINSTSALTRYNASTLMDFRIVDTNKYRITSVNHEWNTSPQTGSGLQTIDYSFTPASHTSQSASTNTPNFRVLGNTRGWLGGNITNQYWNYFQRSSALFTSPSTITNSYGLYVESASASTNATITNNYAAGFQGDVYISGTTISRRINPESDNIYPLGDSNKRWSTIYTKGIRLYETRTGGLSDDDYINIVAPNDLTLNPNPAWTFVLPLLSGSTNSFLGVFSGDSNTSNTTWFSLSGGSGISISQTSNASGGTMTLSSSPTSFYNEPSSISANWDVSGNSTNYKLTLTANTTLNLSNVRNGDYGTIILTQDSTGGWSVTLGTVNGSPATHKVVNGGAGLVSLTATANAIDILSFTYDGTNMYWNKGLNYT